MRALIWSTHYAVTTTRRTKAKFESEVVREWTRTVCLTGRNKESGWRARERAAEIRKQEMKSRVSQDFHKSFRVVQKFRINRGCSPKR